MDNEETKETEDDEVNLVRMYQCTLEQYLNRDKLKSKELTGDSAD